MWILKKDNNLFFTTVALLFLCPLIEQSSFCYMLDY